MTVSTPKSNQAFEALTKTVTKALSDREKFEQQLHVHGIHLEDFDRIVVSILTDSLPGGPFARGGQFTISAEGLYSQLGDADRSAIRALYEDLIAAGRWKLVPPVQWVGPGTLDPSGLKEVVRFGFHVQFGGLKRSAFVDVEKAKFDQLRKDVAAYRADSATQTMPKEVLERVGIAVQQMLNGGISPTQGATIDWK